VQAVPVEINNKNALDDILPSRTLLTKLPVLDLSIFKRSNSRLRYLLMRAL
jgi:hypothetical protein